MTHPDDRADHVEAVATHGADAADLLELAAAVAGEAGELLLTRRPHGRPTVVSTKSSPTDVVTEMDRAAEALITARIRSLRPDDAFLGEEGGESGGVPGETPPVRWIVDPLDGTVNYLYGLPDWAVSIAAEVDGVVLAGVVHVPERGETFTAVKGGGAFMSDGSPPHPEKHDGTPLLCNAAVPLDLALVATGFGYAANRRRVQAEVLAEVLPRVRDIRRAGSAAADLCAVATGRVDAQYERGLQPWDFAAGGLIAREAGARVEGLDGRPASTSMTIAAGPGLFEQLHDLLAALHPERDA